MILMWLGPLILAVVGLYLFSAAVSAASSSLQKRFLELPESAGLFKTVLAAKLCALAMASPVRTQHSAVALLSSRTFFRRYGVLLLCLGSVGTWVTMLAVLLAWQLEGSLFLVASLGMYFMSRAWKKFETWFHLFLGLGIFLSAMQWLQQKQSILLTVLGESEVHFLLADGRFPAQLLWLTVSFVVTLLLGLEFWVIVAALLLVVAGSLSLNGAVGLIIGEMLAQACLLWWRSRKLNQDTRSLVKGNVIWSFVGLVVAFFVAGLLRDAFAWKFTFEASQLTEKSLQFFTLYFVIVAIHALTMMLWGHFAAQKKVDVVQRGEYIPVSWISQGWVSRDVLEYVFKKLNQRFEVLVAQQKELDTRDRGQIPAPFLKEHEDEITRLASWLPQATAPKVGKYR